MTIKVTPLSKQDSNAVQFYCAEYYRSDVNVKILFDVILLRLFSLSVFSLFDLSANFGCYCCCYYC